MKKIITFVVGLIVIVGAIFLLYKGGVFNKQTPEEIPENTPGVIETNNSEVTGSVLSVNTDQAMFDGPLLLVLDIGEDREPISVAVPSMGINLCPAKDNIADVYEIEVGDRVEVLGDLQEDGSIVPCNLDTHYLRVK